MSDFARRNEAVVVAMLGKSTSQLPSCRSACVFFSAFLVVLLGVFFAFARSHIHAVIDLQQRVLAEKECVYPCIGKFLNVTRKFLDFDGMLGNVEQFCSEYHTAMECIDTRDCKERGLTTSASESIRRLCDEIFVHVEVVAPCLAQHGDRILKECDVKCGLVGEVDKITGREDVVKFMEESSGLADLLALLGRLHVRDLCSSFLCFISCSQKNLNDKCATTSGVAMAETAVGPFEALAEYLESSTASMMIARKAVAEECHPLFNSASLKKLKFFGLLPKSEQS